MRLTARTGDFREGLVLIGNAVSHYEVLERLGGGGMGVVYKAWDPRLERYVALKFLSESRGEDEDRQRFIREARTASVLDHPNICTIYEIGEADDGRMFIAMAFVEGESLKKKLDRGPLALGHAVELAAQVAAGLAEAHAKKVVHRDVKPANIMVAADGRAKIVDFGIAWLAGQTRLTQAGSVVGTTAYLAPEQFRRETAGHRADLWSLGVVLYEAITGHLPFTSDGEEDLVRAILKSAPPPMASVRRGVPAALDQIVARALAKRPADRYPTAAAMRSDLLAAAAVAAEAESEAEDTLRESPRPASLGGRAWSMPISGATPATPPMPAAGATDAGTGQRLSLIGRTVGHYRILEHLGGGGMGIVFRAEDLKLARTVALKFLPFELTRDPEAKARFLQEARTASAIDHPNICTIHEVGETDEGQLYLAMACYDGETLKRRLSRGALPVDEAVDIAQQIARGLGKAHRKGIVHRDIKPANLMITSDAVVKILDFGIAKLAGSAILTRVGSSVGSPGYMSPEQARGEEVDARTDLWALGVVFYEMLAGRRPFRGEHDQSVLYSLFHDSPEPLNRVRADVLPDVQRIVDRLLAKEREARYATAADLLADLRLASGQSSTSGTVPTSLRLERATSTGQSRTWGGAARRRPPAWALAAGLGVLAVLAALLWWRLVPREGGARPLLAGPVQASFKQLTFLEGSETAPTLSPDGKMLAYAKVTGGKSDLFLQPTFAADQVVNLTADARADSSQPAFSPDGQSIAFRSEREGGGIFILSLRDRSVRKLTDLGYNPAWSYDGAEIAFATEGIVQPWMRVSQSQIWRVDVASSDRRLVTAGQDAVQPSWSPHGQRIAYWSLPPGSTLRVIWTATVDGQDRVRVTDDPFLNWDPVWSPDGKYLYYASDRGGSMNLWRVPIDEATGKVMGKPEPIPTPSQASSQMSIDRSGTRIAYATSEGRSNLEAAAFDPATLQAAKTMRNVTGGARPVRWAAVSPDGQWLAFDTAGAQENLFVIRRDGTALRQITSGPFKDRIPSWFPDGSRIVFYSNRSSKNEAWSVRPDGTSLEQLTRMKWETLSHPKVSPDGQTIAGELGLRGGALIDLRQPVERRSPRPLPAAGPGGEIFAPLSWSPDGKRLAGNLQRPDGANLTGIVLYSLASHVYEKVSDEGEFPLWLHDGRHLVYTHQGSIFVVDVQTKEARKLLASPPHSSLEVTSVAPDDRTLYIVQTTDEGDIWMVDLK
jgi:serine/threonine protein kinase/Tol biopolymer transport system component